jgi:hypothetical protein
MDITYFHSLDAFELNRGGGNQDKNYTGSKLLTENLFWKKKSLSDTYKTLYKHTSLLQNM